MPISLIPPHPLTRCSALVLRLSGPGKVQSSGLSRQMPAKMSKHLAHRPNMNAPSHVYQSGPPVVNFFYIPSVSIRWVYNLVADQQAWRYEKTSGFFPWGFLGHLYWPNRLLAPAVVDGAAAPCGLDATVLSKPMLPDAASAARRAASCVCAIAGLARTGGGGGAGGGGGGAAILGIKKLMLDRAPSIGNHREPSAGTIRLIMPGLM